MRNLSELAACFGRCFIAVAMFAFGVQHLVYADFVTRLAPKLPAAIPGHVLLACAFGIYLIGSGFALLSKKTARPTALLLAASLFASLAFLYAPALAVNLGDVSLWMKAGKALTLSGGALLIAEVCPQSSTKIVLLLAIITLPLAKCIPFARYFLGGFFAYCGVLHFIYVNFVTGLVPSWIPGTCFLDLLLRRGAFRGRFRHRFSSHYAPGGRSFCLDGISLGPDVAYSAGACRPAGFKRNHCRF
jgi:uncharacterized membrane protein